MNYIAKVELASYLPVTCQLHELVCPTITKGLATPLNLGIDSEEWTLTLICL